MRRSLLWLLLLVLGSCAWFSDGARKLARVGTQGAVQGIADDPQRVRALVRELLLQDDTLERVAGRMADGVMGRMGEAEQKARVAALVAALMEALREHGDPTVEQLLKTAGGQLELTLDTVARQTLARADEAIKRLLQKELMETTELLIRRNADVLSQVLTEKLRGALGNELKQISGDLTQRAVSEALQAMRREENQDALRAVVRLAMREVILGMGDGLKAELRSSPTQVALTAGAVTLGLLLLLSGGALWFYVRQYRTSVKVLAIIGQKINEGGAEHQRLKRAIQEGTQRNQVEHWLSDFLKHRGL